MSDEEPVPDGDLPWAREYAAATFLGEPGATEMRRAISEIRSLHDRIGDRTVSAVSARVFRVVTDHPDKKGWVEKVFVDHTAKPRRAYRTGEFYRPLTEADSSPNEGEEDVVVQSPEDFEFYRYRRVGGHTGFIPEPL